jgi:NAD(P)-dependent dehydrogenase (short-subunit alcohol dehydrogenase family)
MVDTIELQDPRTLYPAPPFDQALIEMPGRTEQMQPRPDHGELSYVGSQQLLGQVALVTGADSGIGRAIAIAYAREGARLVLTDVPGHPDGEAVRRFLESGGAEVCWIPGDLRDERFCELLVGQAVEHFGELSILVNNAAYQEVREDTDDWDTQTFDRIFKTNIYAPFWLSRAAVRHLPAGGCIINTASIQAFDPSGQLLAYAATKSALVGLTKAMAEVAMKHGVRVNAVAPGPVWTPLIPGSMPEDKVRSFGENTVFGRPAQPAELAPLYVWLASAKASYVTGEVFGATGGRTPL